MKPLLSFTDKGIYCNLADVYLDPWKKVKKAVVTHAHADHAKWGMGEYLAHPHTIAFMRKRIGPIKTQALDYGQPLTINGVKISLHPAGHIPGSAQIRLEYKGEIWVVSGDYKIDPDPLSLAFEPIPCHNFITESTFGLPVYQWPDSKQVYKEINDWWRVNAANNRASLLIGYSLGKSQRLLAGLDDDIGPIYTHGAAENLNEVYRALKLPLPETKRVPQSSKKGDFKRAMILAPPSALGSSWIKRFEPYSTGLASGWMALRGTRRRRNVDRGFIMSDHADWSGLNYAVKESGAEKVFVTHGYSDIFSRWLADLGYDARVVTTEFEGELHEIGESKTQEDEGF